MAARKRDYKAEYAKRKARAIIRARELKRGKPLSENYRKRIERGLAKGKSLTEARGKRKGEHIERKLREGTGPGIGNARERFIFQWFVKRDFEIEDWTGDTVEQTKFAVSQGWAWFENYRKTWEALRANYIRELKNGRYASRGMGYIEGLAVQTGAPDYTWLYYH